MKTLSAAIAVLFASAVCAAADGNPGHLRMALCNIKCQISDSPDAAQNRRNLDANLERHRLFIDAAIKQNAEFIGFPELSLNGYHFSKDTTWLKLDGPEVCALATIAARKKVWISAGLAEVDAAGKHWNTHVVLGPDGKVAGTHHKIWLTAERGFVEKGTGPDVIDVKGTRLGLLTCADGTDYQNLKALAGAGARIIYAPHANTTGGTIARWYNFRAKWGGAWDGKFVPTATSNEGPAAPAPTGGWIAQLGVFAALHNHAALYGPEISAPSGVADTTAGWASGAWFIGPDGATLAQMPVSASRDGSTEHLLVYNVPLVAAPSSAPALPHGDNGKRN